MKKYILSAVFALAAIVGVNAQVYNNGWRTSIPKTIVYPTSPTINARSSNVPVVRYQSSYVRSNGTYVRGHMKTVSNGTNWDNFSTVNKVNPYTGTTGTRARDYSPQSYNYGSGRTIHTGNRGGQYYINSSGNKTYVPKRW